MAAGRRPAKTNSRWLFCILAPGKDREQGRKALQVGLTAGKTAVVVLDKN